MVMEVSDCCYLLLDQQLSLSWLSNKGLPWVGKAYSPVNLGIGSQYVLFPVRFLKGMYKNYLTLYEHVEFLPGIQA